MIISSSPLGNDEFEDVRIEVFLQQNVQTGLLDIAYRITVDVRSHEAHDHRIQKIEDPPPQEFGIAAALSRDAQMTDAYRSGDPYLQFGKMCKAIPKNATKQSHPNERELYKATCLAVQYCMARIVWRKGLELQRWSPGTFLIFIKKFLKIFGPGQMLRPIMLF